MNERPPHADSKIRIARLTVAVTLALVGCGADDTASEPDLPVGWEKAERIERFTQTPCEPSGAEPVESEVTATFSAGGALEVDYTGARFRCAQEVEGFVRRSEATADILVQPVDMHPESVAKCDCNYDLRMTLPVPPVEPSVEIVVYRRGDAINRDNDPVRVGSVSVPASR